MTVWRSSFALSQFDLLYLQLQSPELSELLDLYRISMPGTKVSQRRSVPTLESKLSTSWKVYFPKLKSSPSSVGRLHPGSEQVVTTYVGKRS